MANTTITVLQPDFYKDFGCVAAGCRNNCCKEKWRIDVDKASYKKLRGLREPKWLADNMSKYIRRAPDDEATQYATILKNEAGLCAFETVKGLCRIHAELGAEYLCDTCKQYPRRRTLIVNAKAEERGLEISCEEVTRLLLAHPQPLEFVSHTEEMPSNIIGNKAYRDISQLVVGTAEEAKQYFVEVQAVCIGVLQAREYSLEQRMMLLCILLDKLATLEEQGNVGIIPAELDKFVAAVQGGLYDELLNKEWELDVAKLYANYGWVYAFSNKKGNLPPMLAECERGLELTGLGKEGYALRAELFDKLVAERGHLVEHLLVMELWNKAIPFKLEKTMRQCMQYMVATFAVFRFATGAYLAAKGELDDVELIDFVAYFGKSVLHSTANFDQNIRLLEANEMTGLPYLLAIVKG